MTNKTGVLLINLGTPDAATYSAVYKYLREFMSDPRVIERRGLIWWTLLNFVILPRRTVKSSRAYGLIWDRETDESPLRRITRAQARALSAEFSDTPEILVDWAMRYGTPSIESGITRLVGEGCDRVLLFPLYPQYSAATTATAIDKAGQALAALRHQPSIRTVPPYYAHPTYISALAASIAAHQKTLNWTPQRVVLSFHGLPQAFIDSGDPYQDQCEQTAALLRDAHGMSAKEMPLVYQSRGGRAVWTGPELEQTLIDLAHNGIKDLCVITPGFSADCIETLEEVQMRAATTFTEHGGRNFAFIPCLNDSPGSITMLTHIARQHLSGWH